MVYGRILIRSKNWFPVPIRPLRKVHFTQFLFIFKRLKIYRNLPWYLARVLTITPGNEDPSRLGGHVPLQIAAPRKHKSRRTVTKRFGGSIFSSLCQVKKHPPAFPKNVGVIKVSVLNRSCQRQKICIGAAGTGVSLDRLRGPG
jgi:hypothetical protein